MTIVIVSSDGIRLLSSSPSPSFHTLFTVTSTVPVSVLMMVPSSSTPVASPIAAVSSLKLWTYSLSSGTVSTTA